MIKRHYEGCDCLRYCAVVHFSTIGLLQEKLSSLAMRKMMSIMMMIVRYNFKIIWSTTTDSAAVIETLIQPSTLLRFSA
jgi:hypothetical protein